MFSTTWSAWTPTSQDLFIHTEGMSKYPHRSMWCCNDAVNIMPRRVPLQRWCHIFCYSFKEWIKKSPEIHGVDNEIKLITVLRWRTSYFEASQWMSCNLLTHLAWLMWYRMPTGGWWRPVNPKQYEYFLNLAHDICRAVGGFPTPKLIEIALHIPKENRSQAAVPFSNRLGSSSASTMSRDVLQPRQSELMNRQLLVASSSHRTSMSIHTVCIWQPSFQRVHKGWKNTAWQEH